MASYIELFNLQSNSSLLNKVQVAVTVAAEELIAGTPAASDQKWAKDVFDNPKYWGEVALRFVLADNKSQTQAAIEGATDASIQAAVDKVVPSLVVAFNS